MKKIILSILLGLIIFINVIGQDDNVLLNLNAPAYGVRIKSNFPGYSGGWSRGFFIANESNTQIHLGLGVMGGCSNGITDMSYGWIGRDYNDVFLSFKPNGNVGIGTVSPAAKLTVFGTKVMNFNPDRTAVSNIRSGNSFSYSGNMTLFTEDGISGEGLDINYWNGSAYYPAFRINNVSSGFGNILLMKDGGNVLIGKSSQIETKYKLDVEGSIRAHEIVVNTTGADFVFEPTYKLRTLSELETFIRTNKHLPDIAPAKEMQENGVNAGEMQAKLLQKVEELTLYVIEKDKEIATLKAEKNKLIEEQKKRNENLELLLIDMSKRLEIIENKK